MNENLLFCIKWVENGKHLKWIYQFLDKYTIEELATLLYNCWLKSNKELTNGNLDDIFYFNFCDYVILENGTPVNETELKIKINDYHFDNLLSKKIDEYFDDNRQIIKFTFNDNLYVIKMSKFEL